MENLESLENSDNLMNLKRLESIESLENSVGGRGIALVESGLSQLERGIYVSMFW